jgi:hypothetical protein
LSAARSGRAEAPTLAERPRPQAAGSRPLRCEQRRPRHRPGRPRLRLPPSPRSPVPRRYPRQDRPGQGQTVHAANLGHCRRATPVGVWVGGGRCPGCGPRVPPVRRPGGSPVRAGNVPGPPGPRRLAGRVARGPGPAAPPARPVA